MDRPSGPQEPPKDGDFSPTTSSDLPTVIVIAPKGDVLLEVTFENSKSTLKATRKALPKPRPGQRDPPPPQPLLKPQIHLAYRVDLDTLKKHSKYFSNLLGDTRFQEARAIEDRFRELSLRGGQEPGELDPEYLPRVSITDDDEATRSAGREHVFRDMLRVLHGGGIVTRPVTMLFVATLAVMADRFACTAAVSRHLATGLKFKWPATPPPRPSGEVAAAAADGLTGLSPAAEEVLRQKILVSWLLDQPVRFQAATKELVMFGSHRWSVEGAEDEEGEGVPENSPADAATVSRQEALWWYLPDELEEELHYRRTLIMRTIASIPSHFLRLYSSRARQCKLGYDSSPACDSYQLGEMVKFLAGKGLLFLVSFAPSAPDGPVRDFAAVDVNSILAALKQAPGYQVDKHHTHCGLRTRALPILEYVRTMLGSNAVPLSLQGWRKDAKATTWRRQSSPAERGGGAPRRKEFDTGKASRDDSRVFRFTRSVATDQRLRYEGAMAADTIARQFFLAEEWDWTPEEDHGPGASLGREFATTKWLR